MFGQAGGEEVFEMTSPTATVRGQCRVSVFRQTGIHVYFFDHPHAARNTVTVPHKVVSQEVVSVARRLLPARATVGHEQDVELLSHDASGKIRLISGD
jgi:hypothetical protein